MNDVLGPDGPRLLSRECATCIFNPESPFRTGPGALRPGRFTSFVREVVEKDSYIICHDTSHGRAAPAICRGFFDRLAYKIQILRIWGRLGGFAEVDPP